MSDESNLVAAILRRDVDDAIAQLEILKWTSRRWERAVLEGRQLAFPPAPLPQMALPLILPAPGHLPGSTMGSPIIAA